MWIIPFKKFNRLRVKKIILNVNLNKIIPLFIVLSRKDMF